MNQQNLQKRDCPVCGAQAQTAHPFLRRSIDESKVGAFTFASRKVPEFMSYELLRCGDCGVVFACEAPGGVKIAEAYHQAAYDTATEAADAAQTYIDILAPYLSALTQRGVALEIGTGNGIFLRHLRQAGFQEVVGIEPSIAAIEAADALDRPYIRTGIFKGDEFADGSLSLVVCFQTMEHVHEPRELVRAAYRLLQPGGMIALVTHDYTATINRILGKRSPIIDIEHLQLYHPKSLRRLLGDAGFTVMVLHAFKNVYRVGYWIRLLPLPSFLKSMLLKTAKLIGLADRKVRLNVGNIISVAIKPAG